MTERELSRAAGGRCRSLSRGAGQAGNRRGRLARRSASPVELGPPPIRYRHLGHPHTLKKFWHRRSDQFDLDYAFDFTDIPGFHLVPLPPHLERGVRQGGEDTDRGGRPDAVLAQPRCSCMPFEPIVHEDLLEPASVLVRHHETSKDVALVSEWGAALAPADDALITAEQSPSWGREQTPDRGSRGAAPAHGVVRCLVRLGRRILPRAHRQPERVEELRVALLPHMPRGIRLKEVDTLRRKASLQPARGGGTPSSGPPPPDHTPVGEDIDRIRRVASRCPS
jgi:hypothetical protein